MVVERLNMRLINNKWRYRWIQMAELVSSWSEDPSTKVGCVIVNDEQDLLSIGWNGLPRGIVSSVEKIEHRPTKYSWIEHAERNAIYNGTRTGSKNFKGATMYILYFPCCDCARAIIQSGISTIVVKQNNDDSFKERWTENLKMSKQMLVEANIQIIYL